MRWERYSGLDVLLLHCGSAMCDQFTNGSQLNYSKFVLNWSARYGWHSMNEKHICARVLHYCDGIIHKS